MIFIFYVSSVDNGEIFEKLKYSGQRSTLGTPFYRKNIFKFVDEANEKCVSLSRYILHI